MRTEEDIPAHIARQLVLPASYGEWSSLHTSLKRLRETQPLGVAHAPGYDPFWVVTKHADIQEISTQPDKFITNGRRASLVSQAVLAAQEADADGQVPRFLVAMDPPEHPQYRAITVGDFAPRGIRGLEADIRRLAVESVDEMQATGGECDFVADVALRFPLRVIMALMGLPRADEDRMLRMTQELFNPQDPDLGRADQGQAKDIGPTDYRALYAYKDYFDALTDDRRAKPAGDIISTIANARVDGELLPHWDVMSQVMAIATAGHDTTSHSTAGGMWAIAERPDELRKIKAHPNLLPQFVNECIRWTSPLLSFMRTATEDYELRGRKIRKGDWLMLSYPSGNRDEEVFEAPFEFRVDRAHNPHVAFGYGAHLCLGMHLARLEMKILFEEIFRRLDWIELNGEPARTCSIVVGGPKRLPVRFAMS